MNDTINLKEPGPATPVGLDKLAPEDYFPEVSISHPDLVNFPSSGKSVIDHEVVSRTHEKGHDGKHHHRIRLKIKSIRPMGRKKHSTATNQAERAMRDMLGGE